MIFHLIIFGFLMTLNGIDSHSRFLENYTEDKFLPNFITLGQNYRKPLGSTVVLPCKLNKTEHMAENIVAWKHDIAVLTAGMVKVTVNPRIRLIPPQEMLNLDKQTISYNLEIRDVQLIDAGNYVCQISSIVPKEIFHTLEILIPPRIIKHSPTNIIIDVSKGEPIHLECHAEGNPQPKIIWTRKNNNNIMSNGLPNITSNIFDIMHADRHSVGHYKCNADNGVGQLDTRDFIVNVKYPPEIEFESPIVYTGIGIETRLTCIVYADPIPVVSWFNNINQMEIIPDQQLHLHQQIRGNSYDLIIRNVTINDLGNYSCRASNSLGEARLSVVLSALPTLCVFDSPSISTFSEFYNVSWSVKSYTPIREYQLYYRKSTKLLNTLYNHGNNENQFSNSYNVQHYDHERNYYGQLDDKWKSIILPEKFYGYQLYDDTNNNDVENYHGFMNNSTRRNQRRQNIVHKSSYLLRNLISDTSYEIKMQARNDFGWNKISDIYHFTTKPQPPEINTPSVLKAVGVLNKSTSSNLAIDLSNNFFIFFYVFNILLSFFNWKML